MCRSASIILFATLTLQAALLADPVEPVVVPNPVDLPVPAIQQRTDNWCWLAAAEMVVYYRRWGLAPGQCEIMEIGMGAGPGTCCREPAACDRPGSIRELGRVIEHFGRTRATITGPLPVEVLYEALRRDCVVVAALTAPGAARGHVVVIKGLRYVVKWLAPEQAGRPPVQRVVPYLAVNDPRGIITESVPYETLIRIWTSSIVVE